MLNKILPGNPLFRLLFINGLIGVFVALLLLGGILMADVGSLGTLIMGSDDPVLPVVLLGVGLVITLGSATMGTAIMAIPSDDKTGGGPKLPDAGLVDLLAIEHPIPVQVPARAGNGASRPSVGH